jgi:protein-disulfide isomerase/uncharacterized membrane protein
MPWIGLGFAVYLTNHYYELHSGFSSLTQNAVCEISATMSCNQVAMSSYSSLFGYPISLLASGGLFATALLILWGTLRKRPAYLGFALLGSGFMTVSGLVYFGIMVGIIKTLCLFCLLLDACNIALTLGLWIYLAKTTELRPFFKSLLQVPTFIKATLLGLGGFASCFYLLLYGLEPNFFPKEQTATQKIVDEILAQPLIEVPIRPEHPQFGPTSAPITIVEFSDFQCPFCRVTAGQLANIKKKYQDQIRLVFKYFPLNEACNSLIKGAAHYAACEAARLAICMNQQGLFEPTYNALFENQETFPQTNFVAEFMPTLQKNIPTPVDLVLTKTCASSPETNRILLSDVQDGIDLKINGLPTALVNGYKTVGILRFEVWDLLIETLLKRSKPGSPQINSSK